MLFSRSLFVALLSAPLLALADSPNPFSIPTTGLSATAGQPMSLTWTPTTQGTVTLVLRSGNSDDLSTGTVIVSGLGNNGSYTWNVPSTITKGSDYSIEIVDDSDTSETNYTPYFVLDSDVTTSYSTSQVTQYSDGDDDELCRLNRICQQRLDRKYKRKRSIDLGIQLGFFDSDNLYIVWFFIYFGRSFRQLQCFYVYERSWEVERDGWDAGLGGCRRTGPVERRSTIV